MMHKTIVKIFLFGLAILCVGCSAKQDDFCQAKDVKSELSAEMKPHVAKLAMDEKYFKKYKDATVDSSDMKCFIFNDNNELRRLKLEYIEEKGKKYLYRVTYVYDEKVEDSLILNDINSYLESMKMNKLSVEQIKDFSDFKVVNVGKYEFRDELTDGNRVIIYNISSIEE